MQWIVLAAAAAGTAWLGSAGAAYLICRGDSHKSKRWRVEDRVLALPICLTSGPLLLLGFLLAGALARVTKKKRDHPAHW